MSSFILYDGPSLLDGKPIVVNDTGFYNRTNNRKTGDMIQTWILRSDMSPVEALHTKNDVRICGDCIHRAASCYVLIYLAPTNIYKAYKAGRYHKLDADNYEAFVIVKSVLALTVIRPPPLPSYGLS